MREWINQSKIDLLAKEIGEENVPILVNIFLVNSMITKVS